MMDEGQQLIRQRAFQTLYGHSFEDHPSAETLARTFRNCPEEEGAEEEMAGEGAWLLSLGVFLNEKRLDDFIEPHLRGWKIGRLGKSERILLRMGAYELLVLGMPFGEVSSATRAIAADFSLHEAVNFLDGILEAVGRAGGAAQVFDLPAPETEPEKG